MQSVKCEVKEISSLSFIFSRIYLYSLAYTKKEERNCKLCVYSSHNISPTATPFLSFSSSSSSSSFSVCIYSQKFKGGYLWSLEFIVVHAYKFA